MKNITFFLVGLVISSLGLSQLVNANTVETVTAVKAEVILGHRIGPNGQSMLVVK